MIIVLPLWGRRDLLLSWPVLVVAASGVLLYLTQPPTPFSAMLRGDPLDRWSALVLFLSGGLMFLVPIIDARIGPESLKIPDGVLPALGAVVMVGGLAYRYWAIRTLGPLFTTFVRTDEKHKLVTSGPYRHTRHPSYLAALVMAFGVTVVLRSYAGLAINMLVLLPAYLYRIRLEEQALLAFFGEDYRVYQKRTRRLLPWIF